MQIEGSRNERVLILAISYIIGFTTAYIAFGVSQLQTNFDFAAAPQTSVASVIESQAHTQAALATVNNADNFAAITNDGLVAVIHGKKVLLSAQTTPTDKNVILPEGQNTSIANYAMSPSGLFVYFCEVPGIATDSCRPYVYSVEKQIVYPVTQAGQRVAFTKETAQGTWNTQDQLTIGTTIAANNQAPWSF